MSVLSLTTDVNLITPKMCLKFVKLNFNFFELDHGNLGFRFVAYAKHSSTFGPHKYTVLRTLRNLEQRQLSQSSRLLNSQESLKPSSQLEKTVNEIKETQQIADKKLETSVAKDSSPIENQTVEKVGGIKFLINLHFQ